MMKKKILKIRLKILNKLFLYYDNMKFFFIILIILLIIYIFKDNNENYTNYLNPPISFRNDYSIMAGIEYIPSQEAYNNGNTVSSCFNNCNVDSECIGIIMSNKVRSEIYNGASPDTTLTPNGKCVNITINNSKENVSHYKYNPNVDAYFNKRSQTQMSFDNRYSMINNYSFSPATTNIIKTAYSTDNTVKTCFDKCSKDPDCAGMQISSNNTAMIDNGIKPEDLNTEDGKCYGLPLKFLTAALKDQSGDNYNKIFKDDIKNNSYLKIIENPTIDNNTSFFIDSFSLFMSGDISYSAFTSTLDSRGMLGTIKLIFILLIVIISIAVYFIYKYINKKPITNLLNTNDTDTNLLNTNDTDTESE
jgi:hypothetical protein